MGFSVCQKSLFARLVDEGASSPATTTPSRFHLNSKGIPVVKSARLRFFFRKMGFFFRKISCGRDVHAAAPDFTGWSA